MLFLKFLTIAGFDIHTSALRHLSGGMYLGRVPQPSATKVPMHLFVLLPANPFKNTHSESCMYSTR